MLKRLFWFLGLYLLPIGLLLLLLSSLTINVASTIFRTKLYIPTLIKLLIVFIPSLLATLFNAYLFIFKDTRNFNLFTVNAGRPKNVSNDKWKAMQPKISKRYLSDNVEIGTIGYSYTDNKYITIPMLSDLKNANASIVGILAGSGGGKTTTLLTSLVLASERQNDKDIPNYFLFDIKPDIHQKLKDTYKNNNLVSFTENKNELYWGWDFFGGLSEESSEDDIIRHMRMLASCFIYNKEGSDHAAYFYDNARNIFTAMCYGFYKHLRFRNIVDCISKMTSVDLQQNIEQLLNFKDPKLQQLLGIYAGKESESLEDIQTTLFTSLYVFSLDSVRWALKDNPRKTKPEDLLKRNIISVIPDAHTQLLAPLMAAQAEMILQFILGLPDRTSGKDKPLWLIFDELQNLIQIPSLIRSASLVRSKACSLFWISQSVSALQQKYSEKGLNSLLENTSQLIVLSAMEEQTLKLVQNMTGNYRSTMYSTSQSGISNFGNISNSTSEQYRPVYDYEDIRNLRSQFSFICLTNDCSWFRGSKYTIRSDKDLLARSEQYERENEQRRKEYS